MSAIVQGAAACGRSYDGRVTYDLCEDEHGRLSPEDKALYKAIPPPAVGAITRAQLLDALRAVRTMSPGWMSRSGRRIASGSC